LLAFVSPGTLSFLQIENASLDDSTFLRVAHRRLPPPLDPSSSSGSGRSDPPVEQPAPRVLHPGGREQTQESIPIEDVCLGVVNGIMTSHIVFPVLPKGVEDWDIVRYFFIQIVANFILFLLKASCSISLLSDDARVSLEISDKETSASKSVIAVYIEFGLLVL
jgi:hypothetical protein